MTFSIGSTLGRLRHMSVGFWSFYASSCLIDLGLCLYFFLFSLFLVEHNISVHNIGFITAALTVGTIAGTACVSFLTKRLGLQTMMLIYVVAAPVCLGSRVFFLQIPFQIVSAFLAGAMMSIWSVCFSPTLAKLTTQQNRAFGFSLFTATGISSGAIAGVVGGYMPGLLHSKYPHGDGIKDVLLLACVFIMLAAFSIVRLRLQNVEMAPKGSTIFSSFLIRFLVAVTVWNFALNFFTPFANIYLSRHLGLPLKQIGQIYTTSQLIMVGTVLLAPMLYRKVGLVVGVAVAQLTTGALLWALSRVSGGTGAIGIYFGLNAVQWMSGPGISSLLMNRTAEGHRSQASAMQNMLNLASQAGAAALAGRLFERHGYSMPLAVNGLLAVIAAALFYTLLRAGNDRPAKPPYGEASTEFTSSSARAPVGTLLRTYVFTAAFLFLLLALPAWNLMITKWVQFRNPPYGKLYRVEGRQMHLYCSGAGSPTVVIEAGLGNDWLEAQPIQPELSKWTRVCTYDRSGLGWSEPRPGARDAVAIAHQLHALLDVAGIERPLILTGHSAGGIYARQFAGEYPTEVSALVLVDAATPQQFKELPGFSSSYQEFLQAAPANSFWRKLRILSGVQRLAGKCSGGAPREVDRLAGQFDAEKCRPAYEGAGIEEAQDFAKATMQAAAYKIFDGKLVLIISADPAQRTAKTSAADIERAKVWDVEQEEMKVLSAKSWRVTARGSNHNIYRNRPDVVAVEMARLIAYERGGVTPYFGSTLEK